MPPLASLAACGSLRHSPTRWVMYLSFIGDGARVRTALVPAFNISFLVRAPCSHVQAAGGIALTTPNLDELEAMSSAAEENDRVSTVQSGSASSVRAPPLKNESVSAVGTALREGHALAEAAIADGELVDARPLGPPLTAVLAAMLDADIRPASNGESRVWDKARIVIHIPRKKMCAGNFVVVPPKHRASIQQFVVPVISPLFPPNPNQRRLLCRHIRLADAAN